MSKGDSFVHVEIASSPHYSDDLLPKSGTLERLAAEKKLVRKLDMRLLPTIVLIYIMNHIDRNAVANARLKGLQQDLHMDDVKYATVIAILYVTYCPAQVPSNMILNKIARPSFYMGGCVMLWGLTSLLTGVTRKYPDIVACRVFIGLPEAAFFPGAMYLLSRWYTKKELAFRSAIYYSGSLISNSFGSLMGAGVLANMEDRLGIRAWRWLFLIEGSITIFIGLNTMWLLPDYPHNTRWLSPFERRLSQARLSEDAGEADKDDAEESLLHGLKLALKDWTVYLFCIVSLCNSFGTSFTMFFPTLAQTLGFNTTVTLLLAAPPWIFASIICCLNSRHADRTGERFYHIAVWYMSGIIGYIIALSTMSTAGRYVSLFFMTSLYPGIPLLFVWVSNSIPRPPAKRAAAIAIINTCGSIGSIIAPYSWKSAWGPDYHPSMFIGLAAMVLALLLILLIRQKLIRENKKLDEDGVEKAAFEGANRARVEEAACVENITIEEAMERRKGYRYLY